MTEYRKPDSKEIINSKNAPWYISENEKNCLLMCGFFCFVDGRYDEAKKYFEQVKDVDTNVAKLVGLNWPNVYWRLISACNVKHIIFPAEDKRYFRGKNKLRLALAELEYICEKPQLSISLAKEVAENPKSSANEKAAAFIAVALAMDLLPKMTNDDKKSAVALLRKAANLAKKSSIAGTAYMNLGYMYLTVSWKGRRKKALQCFEAYLKKFPEGVFAKDARFKQIKLYLDSGMTAKAELLFDKSKFKDKYPDSGYTLALLRRFDNIKKGQN